MLCLLRVDEVQTFGFNDTVNESSTESRSVALSILEDEDSKHQPYRSSLALA